AAENTLRLWDTELNKELRPERGHTDMVTALSFSRDGQSLLSGGDDKAVRLWDTGQARESRSFRGHILKVADVALSPNGKLALSCTHGNPDPGVRLWDVEKDREVRQLPTTVDAAGPGLNLVQAVAFAPDGKHALACCKPGDPKEKAEGF